MEVITKTFQAENVLLALEKAKMELGSDAIVISMREIPGGPAWQIWRRPGVEILATRSITSNKSMIKASETSKANPEPEVSDQPARAMARLWEKAGVDEPLSRTERKTNSVQSQGTPELFKPQVQFAVKTPSSQRDNQFAEIDTVLPSTKALTRVVARLRNQGVDDEIIRRLTRVCQETLPPASLEDENRVYLNFEQQMLAGLRTLKPTLIFSQRFIFLVGNTGCGKTSLCAKITAYAAQTFRKTTAWISTDTVRTAAISEARTFSGLLGVPLQLAYTPEELGQMAPQALHADLVIVDTPGCNPFQERSVVELGAILTQVPQRNIFLVVSATTKYTDMQQLLSAFSPFNLRGLIFTKMDETNTFGSLYNLAFHNQIPITFFSSGTQVFDDLRPADVQEFVTLILGK
jgi:flagellar biosynthesis protein FlhF